MTSEIVDNIDRRLRELESEIVKLQTARVALIDSAQPAASRKPRRARRSSAKATQQVVPAGKLTALLAGSNGMTTRDLAKATGQPADLDGRLAAHALGFAGQALATPESRAGRIGPALAPPDGATVTSQLVAYLGRRP